MLKKILYVICGFALGFLFANAFSIPESMAQLSRSDSSEAFSEDEMKPAVPSGYGNLVAISGINLYFQGKDGSIYILKPRTNSELDSHVTVIKRSE